MRLHFPGELVSRETTFTIKISGVYVLLPRSVNTVAAAICFQSGQKRMKTSSLFIYYSTCAPLLLVHCLNSTSLLVGLSEETGFQIRRGYHDETILPREIQGFPGRRYFK